MKRNIHATRSGPGRRPQLTSTARHTHEVSDSCEYKVFVRDFSGAKLMRQAEDGVITLRHRGGIVSQTFREMQMRNYQGATK